MRAAARRGRRRIVGPRANLGSKVNGLVHRQVTSARLGNNVHSFRFHRLSSGQLPVQMRFDA
jgi:hypothetical protein